MGKQKKWQLFLILTVTALTIYNILPTLFYYFQPLQSPITEKEAGKIASSIEQRVNQLESESKEWLISFCKQIGVKPQTIEADGANWILRFGKGTEAAQFKSLLPRAGALISFPPSQLELPLQEENPKEVVVQRRIPVRLTPSLFSFAPIGSPLYREAILERAAQIGYALAGPSETALALSSLDPRYAEPLALQIGSIADLESDHPALAARYAAHFTQGPLSNRKEAIRALIEMFDSVRDQIKQTPSLSEKETLFIQAENFLKKKEPLFASGKDPWSIEEIRNFLQKENELQIGAKNPLFDTLSIDWDSKQILLKLHPDAEPSKARRQLMDEAAKVARLTNETVQIDEAVCTISLHSFANPSGFLLLNLEEIGKTEMGNLFGALQNKWRPNHPDLQNLTLAEASSYESLPPERKALSLVVYPPSEKRAALSAVLKGIDQIGKTYREFPDSDLALMFEADLRSLRSILDQEGFEMLQPGPEGLRFQKKDLYQSLLQATREEFQLKGTQKYAYLELGTVEQRILSANRIDTQIHEELIQWNDEYQAAQVSIQPGIRSTVVKPNRTPFMSNLRLSWTKFFRGDEKKILRWGLDLSGGKTVQIELRDANRNTIKNEEEIKQGMNELYHRVNKMGVSEVAIRQLGNTIVLDFPGSQSLSASELIKASSMYFHIVNEKFSSPASPLYGAANRFLQQVWNEAVVTNQKEAQSIHAIAWKHLHGERISESAKTLLENGLVLQSPDDPSMEGGVDHSVSKIALLRTPPQFGQTHPLLIVFKNFTLEGSQLGSIQSNYDPQKGNYLSFEVSSSSTDRTGAKINPRNQLQAWTSRYSKEKIAGTPLEHYSKGNGWRMAVVLNDTVISAPTLEGVIRDSASISGHFSQREVMQLAADLKAGSLSFTPHILSEKNVSPELGKTDRNRGIWAAGAALFLVIGAMIGYYRFAGVIASIAVFFNLLILWATLQNIGATLSLAGIAGIILTVGMAVDANVLVFERFKEEFKANGKIGTAISLAYRKAYSAIADSNITTIIAALILLNFDAGPIKGFAITLIIGIASSMFTALFMTRFYFDRWVLNPKHTQLKMSRWLEGKSIDFLKKSKGAFILAAAIILAGSFFVYSERSTLFGMDFRGGFSLQVEMEPKVGADSLRLAEEAFLQGGASPRDFQIRQLNPSTQLRILFSTKMEQKGKPFFNMPLENEREGTNPRIEWVLSSLKERGLSLTPRSLAQIDANWTAMSGQISETMRNHAIIGLLISFVSIFIYIAIRFEYKFASAAILCVIHDVLMTLAFIGGLHALGVPVEIDLNTIAAIMTIIGYSLNDTIIIFDRIREELSLFPKQPLRSVVNHALNATLSRTAMTSGTTLLVLGALVILGGPSIFSFALVMTIGVFLGTLSSWYIASPLVLFFSGQEKEEREPQAHRS